MVFRKSRKKKAEQTAGKLAAQLAEQAQVLAGQAQELAHQGVEWATPYANEAAERLAPVLADAKVKAVQVAGQAQELAHQGVEWATPRVEEAAVALKPVLDDAARKASNAKDKIVTDYIPKAKRVAAAAAAAAKETEGDLKTRATAIQESAVKALEEPAPKKRRGRKFLQVTAVLTGIGAAVYYLWKRSQPVEDPWAEAYWEDVTSAPTADTPDLAAKAEEVVDKVKDAAEEAVDEASDAIDDAKDKAEEVVEDVKDATEK